MATAIDSTGVSEDGEEENGENEAEGRCTRVFEMRECERDCEPTLGGEEWREIDRGATVLHHGGGCCTLLALPDTIQTK